MDSPNIFTFTPATAGTYAIALEAQQYTWGPLPNYITDYPITGYITVIPKIDSVWLEVDNYCAPLANAPADNKIHFKLKTLPDISSVMHYEPTYGKDKFVTGSSNTCQKDERLQISINGDITNGLSHFPYHSSYEATNISAGYPASNNLYGTLGGTYSTSASVQQDFWATYNDGTTGPNISDHFNGTLKGYPLYIDLNINDGVTLNRTFHAPIRIGFPSSVTSTWTAAQIALGKGSSAYHKINDTACKAAGVLSEIWTPTSNPTTAIYGTAESIYKIFNTLRIPAGKTLTIQNMQVEFGPNGKIDIETKPGSNLPGGYLKLDHATITANHDCSNDQAHWDGVKVWGDATKPQDLLTIGSYTVGCYQGTLEMINGSKLSYASWGATGSGPNKSVAYDRDGGVILASSSSFENNLRSVGFSPYPVRGISISPAPGMASYRSRFVDCDFKVDNDLPNNAFIGFVSGWEIKGLGIYGCRFNNANTTVANQGRGVYGYDFGVNVDQQQTYGPGGNPIGTPIRSSFSKLDMGVDLNCVGGIGVTGSVQHSDFQNNNIGITSAALLTPLYRANTFEVPMFIGSSPFALYPNLNFLGVFINTGSGYGVNKNTFSNGIFLGNSAYNAGRLYGNTGVLVTNSGTPGTINNQVHSNTYNIVGTGNLSNYINTGGSLNAPSGLEFRCNAHSYNTWDEAARGSDPTTDGIAINQGTALQPAGNTFVGTIAYNIYNPSAEVGAINYFHNGGSTFPSLTNGGVTPVYTTAVNGCIYSEDNAGDGGGGPTGGGPIGTGPTTGGRPFPRIAHFLNDPDGIPHRDSLYLELQNWVSPYSDLLKTDLLFEDGSISAGNIVYDSIVAKHSLGGPEAAEFSYWGRRLMDVRVALLQSGKLMNDLTATQAHEIMVIADSARMWAKVRARGWISLYNDSVFVTDMLFPIDTVTYNPRVAYAGVSATPGYTVAPNPVVGALEINYNNDEADGAIFTLSDISGKVVRSVTLHGKNGKEKVDTRALAPGTYFYRFTAADGRNLASGKLIKK